MCCKTRLRDNLNYFDAEFKKLLSGFTDIVEKQFPVMPPLKIIEKTGYIKHSPQYIYFIMTVNEDIDTLVNTHNACIMNTIKENCREPYLTLSPSACFHCYMDLENQVLPKNSIFTFKQHIFRNEGRFNWDDFGRLSDYNVREIVFFGDLNYVETVREILIEKTKELLIKWQLEAKMSIGYDPFVVPVMQKFKKIQLLEKSKYEVELAYNYNHFLAAASFNLHGSAFVDPFNIKINNKENIVSGCVGFGIERWILAFLSQYGEDVTSWPEEMKTYITENR